MTLMTRLPFPWLVGGLWMSLALLVFVLADASSLRSWLALAVVALVPPSIVLRLWTDGPPQTIAEVLHDAEQRR